MTIKLSAIGMAMVIATSLGFSAPAFAQISGDTVKIGIITDMSGLYSDIDGQGGVEAAGWRSLTSAASSMARKSN